MSPAENEVAIPTVVSGARPSTEGERKAMLEVVGKLDDGMRTQGYAALMAVFHPRLICEFKPAGLRISSFDTAHEMFRRTLPQLSSSFAGRSKMRGWSNQNGILREWSYPVRLASGEQVPTTQLEIIEFTDDLKSIKSYRLRMNQLYSKVFVRALGEDFMSLPGIERVPG